MSEDQNQIEELEDNVEIDNSLHKDSTTVDNSINSDTLIKDTDIKQNGSKQDVEPLQEAQEDSNKIKTQTDNTEDKIQKQNSMNNNVTENAEEESNKVQENSQVENNKEVVQEDIKEESNKGVVLENNQEESNNDVVQESQTQQDEDSSQVQTEDKTQEKQPEQSIKKRPTPILILNGDQKQTSAIDQQIEEEATDKVETSPNTMENIYKSISQQNIQKSTNTELSDEPFGPIMTPSISKIPTPRQDNTVLNKHYSNASWSENTRGQSSTRYSDGGQKGYNPYGDQQTYNVREQLGLQNGESVMSRTNTESLSQIEDQKKQYFSNMNASMQQKKDFLANLQFENSVNFANEYGSDSVSALEMNFLKHQSMFEGHFKNAEEETQINQELSIIFLERLENGLRQLEIVSEVMKRLQVGEDFYSKVLEQCQIRIPVDSQITDSVAESTVSLKILLEHLSVGHQNIFKSLRSQQEDLDALVTQFKEALKSLSQFSNEAHKNLQVSRQRLMDCLREYEVSTSNADGILDSSKGRFSLAGIDRDPWEVESALVQAHYHLHRVQTDERQFLKSAFQKVQNLEQIRIKQTQHALSGWLGQYFQTLDVLKDKGANLQSSLTEIDIDRDLGLFRSTGESSESTAIKLEERDQKTLWNLWTSILGSQEVIKQGPLHTWDEDVGDWTKQHYVLTRSGFLYGKNTLEDILPQQDLIFPLQRCQVENIDYPEFTLALKTVHSFFRRQILKVSFRAASHEECDDWAGTIKDAVFTFKQK